MGPGSVVLLLSWEGVKEQADRLACQNVCAHARPGGRHQEKGQTGKFSCNGVFAAVKMVEPELHVSTQINPINSIERKHLPVKEVIGYK